MNNILIDNVLNYLKQKKKLKHVSSILHHILSFLFHNACFVYFSVFGNAFVKGSTVQITSFRKYVIGFITIKMIAFFNKLARFMINNILEQNPVAMKKGHT